MFDLLSIGDIKLDAFIDIPPAVATNKKNQLCVPDGRKNPVGHIEMQVAGSAPNVAIGIARMKKSSAVWSVMGKDATHEMAIDFLSRNHVATDYIQAKPKMSSSFAVVMNYAGESTQLVQHNRATYRLEHRVPKATWLHISELGEGYQSLYGDCVQLHKKRGTRISFNPGVVQIEERKRALFQLIKATDILFVNRLEACLILGKRRTTGIPTLLRGLAELGPRYAVITDGKNGAYAIHEGELFYAPMFPGPRVEATGAGDAFSTGFLGAIMHGLSHDVALAWGSVNAASAVFHVGPTKGLLTHSQIRKRLREHPSYKINSL